MTEPYKPSSKQQKTDPSMLIGKGHVALLDWLADTWLPSGASGESICIIEGFSGVGKTSVARALTDRLPAPMKAAPFVIAPGWSEHVNFEFLAKAGVELKSIGYPQLYTALTEGDIDLNSWRVLEEVLRSPVLLIVDEFQEMWNPVHGQPSGAFIDMVTHLTNRSDIVGRLLFLTNQRLPKANRWTEIDRVVVERLHPMDVEDGKTHLQTLLTAFGRLDDVPFHRYGDVVQWLGGNPRAIRLLAISLEFDALDDLID
ncbi:MAG: ATP-binding protein [Chloroflexota bacterium]